MRIQRSWAALTGLTLILANGTPLPAQAAAEVAVPQAVQPSAGVDYRSQPSLEQLGRELMRASASASSGNVSVTLDKFPTHFTMLSTRVKSGGAELHKNFADIFVVLDGAASEVTGGTIIELAYVDLDRTVIGAAVPTAQPLWLEPHPELRADFFLERRELGVLNVGGAGSVTVDGIIYELGKLSCLYIGRGSQQVSFTSANPEKPACFYLLSY